MTITQTGRRLALVGLLALIGALLPLTGASAIDGDEALELSGDSNTAVSIANSEVVYTPLGEAGPDNPPTEALIGTAEVFADNLASGALQGAALENGRPLLLNSSSDDVDADVLAELDRLLGGTGTVHILGGVAAQGEGVETALTDAGYTVNRFEGATRTETAIAIAGAAGAETALLVRSGATGDDATQAFADSLGAGALAATNGYSVLFTQTEVLTGSTAEFLASEDAPSNVIIVGGTAAISEDTEAEVAEILGEENVSRVAGPTRFDTAVALNGLRDGELGSYAIAVDGQADDSWADGFTMANLSGLNNAPVVLTNQGMVPEATETYLESINDNDARAHLTDTFIVCGASAAGDACAALAEIFGLTVVPWPPVAPPVDPDTGVVTSTNGTDTYTFVGEGAEESTTVGPLDADELADGEFTVDGEPASSGVFFSEIDVCDVVTYDPTGAADGENASHDLVNQDCDDITDGTVGEVDLTAGTFSIIEPVTGTPLRTGIDYTDASILHYVDGSVATFAQFDNDINEGDTIVIEENEDTGVTTLRLANETVSGLVNSVDSSVATETNFSIDGLGDDFMGGDFFSADQTPAPGDEIYVVDGEEVDFAEFTAAISNGDEATYQRVGDEETFTLGNLAPPEANGTVVPPFPAVSPPPPAPGDGGTITYVPDGDDATDTFDYTAGAVFIVDGLLVTEDVFEDNLSSGDDINYRPADPGTSTTERVVLNNEDLAGILVDGDGDDTNDTVQIDVYDENEVLLDTYAPGGSDRYFIDGTEVTPTAFNEQLDGAEFDDGNSVVIEEGIVGNEIRVTTPEA